MQFAHFRNWGGFFISFYFYTCWLLSHPFHLVAFECSKWPGKKFSHEIDKVSRLFCMVQRSWWEIKDRKQLIILLAGTGAQSFVTLYQKPLENCNKRGAPAWGLILGWKWGVVLFRNRQEECTGTCLEYTCVFSHIHLSPCGSSFWHLIQHRETMYKFCWSSPLQTPTPVKYSRLKGIFIFFSSFCLVTLCLIWDAALTWPLVPKIMGVE